MLDNGIIDDPYFLLSNLLNLLTNLTVSVDDPFIALNYVSKPLVILDGWDSITRDLDITTKSRIERSFLSLTDRNIGFMIFITEDLNSTLEQIVDGIIFLEQTFYKSYRLREMSIEKLKGTYTRRPKIPFTLEGGRFKTFSPLSHNIPNYSKPFETIMHTPTHYSSGNPELDKRLNGGYKRGSIVAVEIDEEVDRFVFVPLLAPLVLNFIEQGEGAMVVLSQDQDVSAVTRYLIPYTDNTKLCNLLRVIGSNIKEVTPYVVEIDSKRFLDIYNTWINCYKYLKSRSKGVYSKYRL